jgi:hypothetical protein
VISPLPPDLESWLASLKNVYRVEAPEERKIGSARACEAAPAGRKKFAASYAPGGSVSTSDAFPSADALGFLEKAGCPVECCRRGCLACDHTCHPLIFETAPHRSRLSDAQRAQNAWSSKLAARGS